MSTVKKSEILGIPDLPASPAFQGADKITYLTRVVDPYVIAEYREIEPLELAMITAIGNKRRIRWESAASKVGTMMEWPYEAKPRVLSLMEDATKREYSMFARVVVYAPGPENYDIKEQLTWDVYGSLSELLIELAEEKDPGGPDRSTLRSRKIEKRRKDTWKFKNRSHPTYGIRDK